MMWMLISVALSAELRPVGASDTVESIASDLGDPTLASEIRSLNGLSPQEQPAIGTLLRLPTTGPEGEQQAFLIALTGSATVTDPAGKATPASTWTPINNDSILCTGAESYGTLRLASTCDQDGKNGDDIVLNPRTCLRVQSATSTTHGRSTVVQVTKGSVSVQSTGSPQGSVTVVTPSGLTTGTSGGYRVTIEEAAARTEAIEAPVAVSGGGKEVAVNKGQGSRIRTGEVPSDPVDLLTPGALLRPDDGLDLRRPDFGWEKTDGALGYRFEIAASPTFRDMIYQEDTPKPQYIPSILMLPTDHSDTLYWRISAFDRFGFLGIPSPARSLKLPDELR